MAENIFFKNMRVGAEGPGVATAAATYSGPSGLTKVGHSARDYVKSIDRTTIGMKPKVNATSDDVSGGNSRLAVGFKAADYTVNTTGVAMIVISSLAVAGVGGAFVAAMTGPWAGVVLGVIALVVLVKAAYSNRESCHEKLEKYCWSMIDDKRPENFAGADDLFAASSAALELLSDGKSQMAQLGQKLQKASDAMRDVHAQIKNNEDAIRRLSMDKHAEINAINASNKAILTKAMKKGGAIHQFTRRVVHTGIYMQAPHIVALAMKERLAPGIGLAGNNTDYFINVDMADKSRQLFTKMAAFYTQIMNAQDVSNNTQADARKKNAGNNLTHATNVNMTGENFRPYRK